MQVIVLNNQKQLKKFIAMADDIYRGDKFYVPFMRADLFGTLKKLVLKEKTYFAIAVEDGGKYVARILITISRSKRKHIERCGYFSHFECIDDKAVARMLFDKAFEILRERGVNYIEGSYFPYDQDNRRGILAAGFESEPMILTSYNPPYYNDLLLHCGFKKDFDTVSYLLDYKRFEHDRVSRITAKMMDRCGLSVSPLNFSRLDREIDDVFEVISAATNDIIFQDAPTKSDLQRIAANWKPFLWADFIHICRQKSDGKPVGVMMSIPNYYTVFRKMNGKINPVALAKALWYRSRIKSARAMLQYVIPEYQNKGVNFALYNEFYASCKRRGITHMEAGTIMEDNFPSRINVEGAGGIVNKIFRIYGTEL